MDRKIGERKTLATMPAMSETTDRKIGERLKKKEKRNRKRKLVARVCKKRKRSKLLSEKKRAEKEEKPKTKTIEEEEKEKKKKLKLKYKKKLCDMTKDEIVNLCFVYERPRARLVVDKLRNYLIQVSQSKFDCDVFPGYFTGVTSVCPIRYRPVSQPFQRILAKAAISKYNSANKETKYEAVDVENINVASAGMMRMYYVTFNARDVNNATDTDTDGALKTFQAVVFARPSFISHVSLCRPKNMDDM